MVWSPSCPRDSQVSSPAPQLKSISSSTLSLLYGPNLTSWNSQKYKCMCKKVPTVVPKRTWLLWADSRGRYCAILGSGQRDHLEKVCSPGLFRIQLLSSVVLLSFTVCYYAAGWEGSLGGLSAVRSREGEIDEYVGWWHSCWGKNVEKKQWSFQRWLPLGSVWSSLLGDCSSKHKRKIKEASRGFQFLFFWTSSAFSLGFILRTWFFFSFFKTQF